MFVLEKAGILVEAYPGKGYNKPIKQMIDEISKAGKLSELRDRLIKGVATTLEKVIPMYMDGIHSDTRLANTINIGIGPSNQREAKEKAREILDQAREKTGVPVYLRKYHPVGMNGSGEWLAYFNLFSDDYGNCKIEDIASLLTNNDEYWEILDDIYTKRTNKFVNHEPSKEEKLVSSARNSNTLVLLNRITRATMTKKDWERFSSSTIGRQLAALYSLGDDKIPSRKHAILLMVAKKYVGIDGRGIDFGNETVDVYKIKDFLRSCGFLLPNGGSYQETQKLISEIRDYIEEIRDYFSDELEVLEQ